MPGDVSHLSPTVSALFKEEQLMAVAATRLHLSQGNHFYLHGGIFGTVTLRCAFIVTCSKQNHD